MSANKDQHFVPEGHLKRFAVDKKIFVTKVEDCKEFMENIEKIAYIKYGYSSDPALKNSFEKVLSSLEDYLIKPVDKILNGCSGNSDDKPIIFYYMAMLQARSLDIMSNIEDKKQILKLNIDSRNIHFDYFVQLGIWNVCEKPYEYYDVYLVRSNGSKEFITSDCPVVETDAKIALKNCSDDEISSGDEGGDSNIVLCPLSSQHCGILTKKNSENKYVRTVLNVAEHPEFIVDIANGHVIYRAVEDVYSKNGAKELVKSVSVHFQHPEKERKKVNLKNRRKIGKNKIASTRPKE